MNYQDENSIDMLDGVLEDFAVLNSLDADEADDLAALNALASLEINNPGSPPDHILNAPILDDSEEPATPIQNFLMQKIDEYNAEEKKKYPNRKDNGLNTPVPKFTQTNWFADFNQQMRASNEPESIIISKLNGFFYTGEDTPEKALADFGIEPEKIQDFADHFQMVYFGNTRSRTKNNNKNENGFKSFVLQLKNPKDPNSQAVLKEVEAAKRAAVMAKIEKSYDLQKATEHLIAKAPNIIAEEVNKTGVQPFVGSQDQLFLNASAVRAEVRDKIPEIDGLYNIEPLDVKGNKVTYTGFSESLDSYFEDELKICKITTKDSTLLTQDELERIISERLSFDKGHLAAVPQDAMIQQLDEVKPDESVEKNNKEETLDSVDQDKSEKPVKKKQDGKDRDFEEQDSRNFNRKKNSEQPEETTPLAKAALEAATKLTQAALTAIIALAILIAQMIMALIKRILNINGGPDHVAGNVVDTPWANFKNTLRDIGKPRQLVTDVENTKDISLEDQAKDLVEALDVELGNEKALKADLTSELDLAEVKPLDKFALAKDGLEKINQDVLNRLDADAENFLSSMSEQDKKDYLSKISVPALHQFDENLPAKLSDPLQYDLRHGVLLARNDGVDYEGKTMGVLAAYDVGGRLYYALASENANGEYDVHIAEANLLKLKEHNAFKFDNVENLISQVDQKIAEALGVDADKVESIPVLDRDNLTGSEISIAELYTKTDFVKPEQLGLDTSAIPVEDLLKNNKPYENDLYYSIPQLHHDKTGDLDNQGKHNAHGFYGHLLDINDQIECVLPNSSVPLKGSIAGAYTADHDLYYQVYQDNQFYSIKADEISLIKRNGGDLTDKQIELLKSDTTEGKDFKRGSIPVIHESIAKTIPLLSQKDPDGFDKSYQQVFDNSIIKQGMSNIGVQPLVLDDDGKHVGAGRLISMKQYSGSKSVYVSLGETIDPVNGAKKIVAVEVNNTLGGIKPLTTNKNKLVQLNLDDPDVKIEAAGFTNESLRSFVDKARQIYEKGAFRKQATLAARYIKDAGHAFAQGNESKEIAKEYHLQNKIALGLLEAEAKGINAQPQVELGLNANLANMSVDTSTIQQAINQPFSRMAVPSQVAIESNPKDLVYQSLALATTVKDANVNELIDNVAYSTLGDTSIEPKLNEIEFNNNPLVNLKVDPALEEPVVVSQPEVTTPQAQEHSQKSIDDLVKQFQDLPVDSPIHKIADFAISYAAGRAILGDQSDSLDVLSAKDAIDQRYEKLNEMASTFKTELSDSIEATLATRDPSDPANTNNQLGIIHNQLKVDGVQSFALDYLMEDRLDIKAEQREHLEHFAQKLSELSNGIDHANLEKHEVELLESIKDAVSQKIEEQIAKYESTDRLLYAMDRIRYMGENTTDDQVTAYVDKRLESDNEKTRSFADTIFESLSPNKSSPKKALTKENDKDYSNNDPSPV